ncbi:hypothetical protein [Vibrio phage vB_ValS_PJ32]|nr:hypothetical protein [Vibrio phage vB_ValS_PJ32]
MKLVRFYTDEAGAPLPTPRGEPWHYQLDNAAGSQTLCGTALSINSRREWHTKNVTRTRNAICRDCLKIMCEIKSAKLHGQDLSSMPNAHGNTGKRRSPETVRKIKETKKRLGITNRSAKLGQGKIYDGKEKIEVYRVNPHRPSISN